MPADDEILAEAEKEATDNQWTYVTIVPLGLDPEDEYMTAVYFKTKVEGETFFKSISQFHIPRLTAI